MSDLANMYRLTTLDWAELTPKVRTACGYIADDRRIAQIYGIEERDVARIRAPKRSWGR